MFKRCKDVGCTKAHCTKHLYVKVKVTIKTPTGKVQDQERGPMEDYLHLWKNRTAGFERAFPETKQEQRELERLVRVWIVAGRPAETVPVVVPDPDPAPENDGTPRTVGDLLERYRTGKKTKRGNPPSQSVLNRLLRPIADGGLGAESPVSVLWDFDIIEDYLSKFRRRDGSAHSPGHANAHRRLLVNLDGWAKARYKSLRKFETLFARHYGIGEFQKPKHRTRRLYDGTVEGYQNEDRALDAACTTFATTDGGLMLGRYHCAIDSGIRLSEMLNLKREDVKRDYQKTGRTYLYLPETKNGFERWVPVSPRMQTFLDARRFARYPYGTADGSKLKTPAFGNLWRRMKVDASIDVWTWGRGTTKRKDGRGWKRVRVYTVVGSRPAEEGDALHWHDLRHEAISRLGEQGLLDIEIAEMSGHKDLNTVRIYTQTKLHRLGERVAAAQAHLVAAVGE
jgi:integrase